MISDNKLISIAMATYNGEKYLREQLESIYNQTYKHIEVIVCDDCSTDRTAEILSEYAAKYDNFSFEVNASNLGFVKNFEKAILKCQGEYIALADQDDIWLPEKLERLLELRADKDVALVYSDAELIDDNGDLLEGCLSDALSLEYVKGPNAYVKFLKGTCITGCTVLFESKLCKYALPFPPGIPFHDHWLGYVSSRIGMGIDFTWEPLIQYRQHSDNVVGVRKQTFGKGWISKRMGRIRSEEKKKSLLKAYVDFENRYMNAEGIAFFQRWQQAFLTRICPYQLKDIIRGLDENRFLNRENADQLEGIQEKPYRYIFIREISSIALLWLPVKVLLIAYCAIRRLLFR